MTIQFPPAPTYADPVIADEITGKVKFNPLWLRWFLDLAGLLTAAGGGAGSFDHNSLLNLQGGTAGEYYHLTAAQHTALTGVQSANTVYAGPTTGAAAAPTFRGLVNADLPTNILAAGTLGSVGNFAINTNKFTVAASTGNTAVAGTLVVADSITATKAQNAPTQIGIINTSSGTGGVSSFNAAVNASLTAGYSTRMEATGSGYAGGGTFAPAYAGLLFSDSNMSGGLSIAARHVSGDVRIYAGGIADADLVATFADDLSTSLAGSLGVTGATTLSSTLAVNGNTLSTSQTTFNLINTTATTVNFAGGATAGLNIGNTSGSTVLKGVTISLTPSSVPALIIGSSGGGSDATWLAIQSNATGGPPLLYAAGSDTDIDLRLRPKGTGYVQFGGYNAATTETFSGFITMKDDGGTLRKMMICT